MDVEDKARMLALELLLTQLIAEQLRAVPDPEAQQRSAGAQLARAADELSLATESLDEEARLRVRIKEKVSAILEAALAAARAAPRQARDWQRGYEGGA
jgi:hypothetical protein